MLSTLSKRIDWSRVRRTDGYDIGRGPVKTREKKVRHATSYGKSEVASSTSTVSNAAEYFMMMVRIALISLIVVAGGYMLTHYERVLDHFPVEDVIVEAPFQYVSEKDIEDIVLKNLASNFFTTDLGQIKRMVENEPWVQSVDVTRRWPATINVVVREYSAIGIWGGEYLISRRGELFSPGDLADHAHLPQLNGPAAMTRQVLENYHEMSVVLRSVGLKLDSLNLSNMMSWQLVLGNGVVVTVDRERSMEKLMRFVELYPNLHALGREMSKIDLRYDNGLAVAWQETKAADKTN